MPLPSTPYQRIRQPEEEGLLPQRHHHIHLQETEICSCRKTKRQMRI